MNFPSYYITIDVVIFRAIDNKVENSRKLPEKILEVLTVKRDLEPFRDMWSLPGGFLTPEDTLEETVNKKLKEKLNIENIYVEQLYTWSDPLRDTYRDKRVISVSYLAIVNSDDNLNIKEGFNVNEFRWLAIQNLANESFAFDHGKIIDYAFDRLKNKIAYTDISLNFMPKFFTMASLRKVVEAIENREIFRMEFKRNFEKYLEVTDILESTGAHKSARLMTRKG